VVSPESKHIESPEVPEDFYERVSDCIRERIAAALHSAVQVVDLGCGSCELDRFLTHANGQHVIGVDISGSSFPDYEAPQPGVECRKADARRLDFIQDRSVDAVVSVHALHEMDKPVEVLTEAHRVLRAGGEMLVVDCSRGSLAQGLWNENYYASAEVTAMLGRAGFARIGSRLIERKQLIWAEGHKSPIGKETP